MRKPTRKTLMRKADDLWSLLVKKRANVRCEYCGGVSRLNAHHVYSRSNKAIRWDVENGVCLCAGHHALSTWSAHKSPMEFIAWITAKRGKKWAEALQKRSNRVCRFKDADLQEIIDNLKQELEAT